MKKAIALISAAVLIFGAAGCANKQPDPDLTTESKTEEVAASASEDVSGEPESASAENTSAEETVPPPSSTAVVVVTGGKEYGIEQPDVTSVVELVTTIAPPKPRPSVTERATSSKPTTTAKATTTRAAVPAPDGEPELVYPDVFSVTESGATDSIAVLSYKCEYFEERGTFGITVSFDIKAYSGTKQGMYVAYNCYDKNGKKQNDKLLTSYVPLSGEDKTVTGLLTAKADTARIEMVSYY